MAKIEVKLIHQILRGLVTLMTGLFLLLMPGITMQTALILIGALLLISGLVDLFLSNRKMKTKGFFSLQGLFNMVVGLSFLVAPTGMLKLFVVFLGIILVLIGTVQLIGSLTAFSLRGWSFLYFTFALIMLSGGFLLLFNPFKSLETIVSFIGILLIFYGISQMVAVQLKRKTEYYKGSPVEDITHEEI